MTLPFDAPRPTQDHEPVVYNVGLDPRSIDQDALRVLSRLQRNGHEAYLVGGCVRDLLLGRRPKDFDVATQAHPRQVKRLFRNGRIIGRRFRLVHVVYGRQIVETATFRTEPVIDDSEDLLITEDNQYGTAAEDARRRDFTVNGLFYDPTCGEVHDWVDGIADLEEGLLRTIGDPRVRFAEDPVRILRAVKFATRLGFRIEEKTWEAMSELAPDLSRSAPPRVAEEILRLMRSGTSLGAFRMLRACGALKALLPQVDDYLGTRDDPDPRAHDRADLFWRLLEALDADMHVGKEPSTGVLVAVLFLRVIENQLEQDSELSDLDRSRIASEVIQPLAARARLPRRAVEQARRIIALQPRFLQPPTKHLRRILFLRSDDFPEALHLFRLRCAAWGQGWDVYEGWLERSRGAEGVSEDELSELRHKNRRKRRRGKRRGRRGNPAGPDEGPVDGAPLDDD